MNNEFLKGKNIYLRPLKDDDLKGNYISWLNDPEVCKYNSHHTFPYTIEKAKAYISSVSGVPNMLVLAIVLNGQDRHIGNVSLQDINYINRSAEFAIVLGEKDCWGKGFSREAASLIVAHAFTSLNLNRVYCGTSSENIPMQKLAKYLGMKEEGRRRNAMFKNGIYTDIIEYGLLKQEYLDSCNVSR